MNKNTTRVGVANPPAGNIAEALLKEGMAKCIDWRIAKVNGGPQKNLEKIVINRARQLGLHGQTECKKGAPQTVNYYFRGFAVLTKYVIKKCLFASGAQPQFIFVYPNFEPLVHLQ